MTPLESILIPLITRVPTSLSLSGELLSSMLNEFTLQISPQKPSCCPPFTDLACFILYWETKWTNSLFCLASSWATLSFFLFYFLRENIYIWYGPFLKCLLNLLQYCFNLCFLDFCPWGTWEINFLTRGRICTCIKRPSYYWGRRPVHAGSVRNFIIHVTTHIKNLTNTQLSVSNSFQWTDLFRGIQNY